MTTLQFQTQSLTTATTKNREFCGRPLLTSYSIFHDNMKIFSIEKNLLIIYKRLLIVKRQQQIYGEAFLCRCFIFHIFAHARHIFIFHIFIFHISYFCSSLTLVIFHISYHISAHVQNDTFHI